MKKILISVFQLVFIGTAGILLFNSYSPIQQETIVSYKKPFEKAESTDIKIPIDTIIEKSVPPNNITVDYTLDEEIPTAQKNSMVNETLPTVSVDTQKQKVTISTQNFYSSPPLSLDEINKTSIKTIVNILCGNSSNSLISGATGSGIIIDPRGIILTNAHVAQHVLLQDHPNVKTNCVIRTGAPAKSQYTVELLAMPNSWVEKNAKKITTEMPTGTGEDDWALLYITGRTDGSKRPKTFPYTPFDKRMGVASTGSLVLLSSYPAGFLGGATIQRELWPVSTIVSVQKVFTFVSSTIDVLSLGGNIVAQGGSSGGGVINQWGYLVGIITTTSLGDVTDDRDLRAITMSHINTSFKKHTGQSLDKYLQTDIEQLLVSFKNTSLPKLLNNYKL